MSRRSFPLSAIAGCLLSLPATAQDQTVLETAALEYLDEVMAAAHAQADTLEGETNADFLKLIANDERWVNPHTQLGIGSTLAHFGLYVAQSAQAAEEQIGAEAARVSVTISYDQVPDFDWPAQIDFVQVKGDWKIRDIRLVQRRVLPPAASPDDVLVAYLDGMQGAIMRHATLPRGSWIEKTLQSHWVTGGGGHARLTGDCPSKARADCASASISGVSLWSALALDREKTVEITDFRYSTDGPVGEVTVTIPRRTMIDTRVFDVSFAQDKRHGWQIASVEQRREEIEIGEVDIDVDDTDGSSLVASLFAALTGPDAPSQIELLSNIDVIEPYWHVLRSFPQNVPIGRLRFSSTTSAFWPERCARQKF